mgnify:CR=1 FL=1
MMIGARWNETHTIEQYRAVPAHAGGTDFICKNSTPSSLDAQVIKLGVRTEECRLHHSFWRATRQDQQSSLPCVHT